MIYYFKGQPIQMPFKVESNTPVFSSDTVSLKSLRASQDAQRWELSFSLLANSNYGDLLLDKIEGSMVAQSMIMPQLPGVFESATGTTLVAGAASAGASTISLTTNNGLLPQFSFISFTNHSKVYMTKTARSGTGTVSIYPELRASIPAGSTVRGPVSATPAQFVYVHKDGSISGIVFENNDIVNAGTIELMEAL